MRTYLLLFGLSLTAGCETQDPPNCNDASNTYIDLCEDQEGHDDAVYLAEQFYDRCAYLVEGDTGGEYAEAWEDVDCMNQAEDCDQARDCQ